MKTPYERAVQAHEDCNPVGDYRPVCVTCVSEAIHWAMADARRAALEEALKIVTKHAHDEDEHPTDSLVAIIEYLEEAIRKLGEREGE